MLTSLTFDMRAPDFGAPPAILYAEALAMSQFADKNGFDLVNLQEHHGSEDGYLPTPFILGAAIAACTSRIRLHLGAVILPLHNPVEIAEQIAVTDLVSNGRLEVTFGAGYVPAEFALMQVSLSDRAKRMDNGIELILRALSGERFEFDGREVFIRPLPLQDPRNIIFVGGGVPAAAKRAARFGVGFYPLTPSLVPTYKDECLKLGKQPGRITGSLPWVHVSDDPDTTWEAIAPNILHSGRMYSKWVESSGGKSIWSDIRTIDDLKSSEVYRVLTPDDCIAFARKIYTPGYALQIAPLFGGMAPDMGWSNLKLFAEKVLPFLPR